MTELNAEEVAAALDSCKCNDCRTAVASKQAPPWGKPLLDLVGFEKSNGKAHTLVRHDPLNFELLAPLNHDILSVHGVVDVDWMFRVAMFSGSVVTAYLSYVSGKLLWNTTRGLASHGTGYINAIKSIPAGSTLEERIEMLKRGDGMYKLEYGSVLDPANRNAPFVANAWLKPNMTLERLFAPALLACRASR